MTILPFAALLFDLDGVLIDSTAAVERAWARWADEIGVDVQRVMAQAHGRRTVDTVRAVAPHLDAAAEARRIEEREGHDTSGVAAYPGAAPLLDALRDQRWAIVTSGSRWLATARLEAVGLPVPAVFVAADDVTAGKPDPACFLAAARALAVDPHGCLVVEDSPAGIASAHAAGMRVVAVTTTHTATEVAEADVVVGGAVDGLRIDDGALLVTG